MPLYEYQCEACAHRFERIRKFSDPPLDACPSCGGAVRKLLSSPAIQFKGTGWYITDYAKKSPSDGAKGSSSGDSAKSDAGKTDSSSSDSSSKTTGTKDGGGSSPSGGSSGSSSGS